MVWFDTSLSTKSNQVAHLYWSLVMLSFDTANNIDELVYVVSVELSLAFKTGDQISIDSNQGLSIREIIPVYQVPVGIPLNDDFSDHLQPDGWHIQVYQGDAPLCYVRADFDKSWRIGLIGENKVALDVAKGISLLDNKEPDLPDSTVVLLSSNLYKFSTLWVQANNSHFVVSSDEQLSDALPIHHWLSSSDVAIRIKNSFGEDFGQWGIYPDTDVETAT